MGTTDGIISTDEARRMLVEQGVLPEWFAATGEAVSYGSENDTAEGEGQAAVVEQKARRARLGPGEDFVRVNRAGEVRTLWTSKRVYAIPFRASGGERNGQGWTLLDRDGRVEASPASPFGVGWGARPPPQRGYWPPRRRNRLRYWPGPRALRPESCPRRHKPPRGSPSRRHRFRDRASSILSWSGGLTCLPKAP